MTISYPVTAPTSVTPDSVTMLMGNANSVGESPYTAKTQVYQYDGDWWGIEVSYPVLTREEAAVVMGFLASLRGRQGTFLWGPTLFASPQGAAGGTPRVNGASQTGYSIATDGWTPSAIALKAGDFFEIDSTLYMAVADATANGSGAVTIDIWPSLRGHADNAVIVTESPVGTFRLLDSVTRLVDSPDTKLHSITFQAKEAR